MSRSFLVGEGALLAAWPELMDPNFMHSVVLLCQHTPDGAYGLVTNQATELLLRDLLPEHELLGRSEFPVHLGGPVDHSTMQFLHRVPSRISGGVPLGADLWIGGDLDELARYLDQEPEAAARTVRVFLGYSGWGAGQLDDELEQGSWIPADATVEAVFGAVGEPAWRSVVRSTGRAGEELQNLPPDTSWN